MDSLSVDAGADLAASSVLDEMLTIGRQLEQLAAALFTALATEDVPTFALVVHGREPLLTRWIALWEVATPAERMRVAPIARAVLEHDVATLDSGQRWLHDVRAQITQLQQGLTTLERYGAPIAGIAAAAHYDERR